jgi:nitroreductase
MSLLDLITTTRSYRRFDANTEVSEQTLRELVNLGRLASSARNLQPLKYMLVNKQEERDLVFPLLAWAGALKDWDGPAEHEQPMAYIILLKDTEISNKIWCDDGLSMQNILLGATEKGLGGCILGAVNRDKLRTVFAIDPRFEILYVIALGKPAETVVLEEVKNNETTYWRDTNSVHHVPKRGLDEVIVKTKPSKF